MFNIFLTVFFSTLASPASSRSSSSGISSRSRSSVSTKRSSWPTPAAPGTTPRRSSRSSQEKGTALHEASIVGDTVGDPFKDTSSVAMNPTQVHDPLRSPRRRARDHDVARRSATLAVVFFALSLIFVHRSFYGMRIPLKDK
jgi:K(+)-stimulated pyrophosphate-energized sodium pump